MMSRGTRAVRSFGATGAGSAGESALNDVCPLQDWRTHHRQPDDEADSAAGLLGMSQRRVDRVGVRCTVTGAGDQCGQRARGTGALQRAQPLRL